MKNKTVQTILKKIKRNAAENRMSRKARLMAAALCAALVLGQVSTAVYAQTAGAENGRTAGAASGTEGLQTASAVSGSGDSRTATTGSSRKDAQTAGKGISSNQEDAQTSKEETVYILADADGSVQKIIVSDWIKNIAGMSEVYDRSELNDLETVRDELACTEGTDNAKGGDEVWVAEKFQ